MKAKTQILLFGLALLTSLGNAAPLGTEFIYNGRLTGSGASSSGPHDFTFRLCSAPTGTPLASVVNLNVPVASGLFTTSVDFGPGYFNGTMYWLEIAVRTTGSGGAYTTLSPRQPLSPTPNASFAVLAGTMQNGSVTSSKLATDAVTTPTIIDNAVTAAKIASAQVVKSLNAFHDDVTVGQGSNVFVTAGANNITVSAPTAWYLYGNTQVGNPNPFLGTTDPTPLVVKVNNAVALRIDPAANGPNIIGGLAAIKPTAVTAGVRGAVVAGGGAPAGPVSGFGGGDFHAVYDSDGAIGGGFGNKVGNGNADVNDAAFATVGGGVFNSAAAYASTVAGGDGNYAPGVRAAIGGGAGNQAWSPVAAIAGGANNIIMTNSPNSMIGGGQSNSIETNAPYATIAGGKNNFVSPGDFGYVSAKGATIAGGEGNTVFGSGGFPEGPLYDEYGTIGGGYGNAVRGSYGTVPGGYLNTAAGDYSFAAGYRALADYGCFVWADGSFGGPFSSTGANQFCIRATGGVRLNQDTSLFFNTGRLRQMLDLWNGEHAIGVQAWTTYFRTIGGAANGGFAWYKGGAHNDLRFNPGGGAVLMTLDSGGLVVNGTFVSLSDRNAKENLKPVNSREVLDKVAVLPITRWNFKEDPNHEHVGPMAQDFYAAFGLGADDKHIATVDADGVALAAIQGLNRKLEEKEARIQALERTVAELKRLMTQLTQVKQAQR